MIFIISLGLIGRMEKKTFKFKLITACILIERYNNDAYLLKKMMSFFHVSEVVSLMLFSPLQLYAFPS